MQLKYRRLLLGGLLVLVATAAGELLYRYHIAVQGRRLPTDGALYDVWVSELGLLWPTARWLPDLLAAMQPLWSVLWCGWNNQDTIKYLGLWLVCYGSLLSLRVVTTSLTVKSGSPLYLANPEAFQAGGITNRHVFDMMFSGHTAAHITAAYAQELLGPFWLTRVWCLLGALAQLVVGDHYTVDVLIALLLGYLLGHRLYPLERLPGPCYQHAPEDEEQTITIND